MSPVPPRPAHLVKLHAKRLYPSSDGMALRRCACQAVRQARYLLRIVGVVPSPS